MTGFVVRSHNYLIAALLLLGSAAAAHASPPPKVTFMGDFVQGISIPLGDGNYRKFADPSYKLGIRGGAVFYIGNRFGIAPEGEFDYIPVNTNDGTYQNNGLDAIFNRIRFLAGARFIVPFGIGSFYVRAGIGVDYITGSIGVVVFGNRVSTGYSSTAFTFEPGFGVQFNVYKHLVVGITSGFPIAAHDTGNNHPLPGLNNSAFTAVDMDFLAVFGVRFP